MKNAKIITNICSVIVLLISSLTACDGHQNKRPFDIPEKEITKLVIDCFNRNDAKTLKSLLSDRTQGMQDIDEQIHQGLDFIGGGIQSFDDPKYQAWAEGKNKQSGVTTKEERHWYIKNVLTESGDHFDIFISVKFIYMRDLAREGITHISITREDGEKMRIGYPWQDYSEIAKDTGRILIDKIEAGDIKGIQGMFSMQSQENGDLEGQINELVTFYEGLALRGKPEKENARYDKDRDFHIDSAESETVVDNEPVRIFIDGYVDNIMTDSGNTYIMRFYMYNRNDASPDAVGISQITLIRSDGIELSAGELIREQGDETQVFLPYG